MKDIVFITQSGNCTFADKEYGDAVLVRDAFIQAGLQCSITPYVPLRQVTSVTVNSSSYCGHCSDCARIIVRGDNYCPNCGGKVAA